MLTNLIVVIIWQRMHILNIMLCTLELHNFVCQLYVTKAGKISKYIHDVII